MTATRRVPGTDQRVAEGSDREQAGRSFTVLIAEDDQVTSRTMGLMIAWEFPRLVVETVADGRHGVARFAELNPDIVIADLDLPGIDGLQMAREIKSLNKQTPVIVVTGCGDRRQLAELCEIGVSHCIMKPYRVQELFEAIENCIAQLTRETDLRSYNLF